MGVRRRRGPPRFVVHKHDTRCPHYDLRLEAGGVLKSWAVPKGPSLDPGDKRLAVRTEDHRLDYADFEGVIPRGEPGAGPVIVWDIGTFGNLTEHGREPVAVETALERGHLAVWLEGEKLRGGFALTRIRRGDRPIGGRRGRDGANGRVRHHAGDGRDDVHEDDGTGDVWLMVKMSDEASDPDTVPVRDRPASVLSGRTIEEMVATVL